MFPTIDANRLSVVIWLGLLAGQAGAQDEWQAGKRPQMPALTGLPRSQAEQALHSSRIDQYSVALVPGAEPGVVVKQFPPAGMAVTRATLYVGIPPRKAPGPHRADRTAPSRPTSAGAWWFFLGAQPLLLLWLGLELRRSRPPR